MMRPAIRLIIDKNGEADVIAYKDDKATKSGSSQIQKR